MAGKATATWTRLEPTQINKTQCTLSVPQSLSIPFQAIPAGGIILGYQQLQLYILAICSHKCIKNQFL